MRRRRSLRVCLLAVALAWLPAAAPPAAAAAQDTTAVAINTHDGFDLFRLAFAIKRVMGDTVDPRNAAVAVSSCDSCTTIAIAIQVVLVMSDPDLVAPTNLALAANIECTLCETLASASQYVFGLGEPLRLTAAGNARLAQIRRELLALRHAT